MDLFNFIVCTIKKRVSDLHDHLIFGFMIRKKGLGRQYDFFDLMKIPLHIKSSLISTSC